MEELQKQTNKRIWLGTEEKRQFYLIYDKRVIVIKDNHTLKSEFSFIYRVSFPDTRNNCCFIEDSDEYAKAYICAYNEIKMKPFVWKPYDFNIKREVIDTRVGVHFFGHTSPKLKFCPIKTANKIWKEIESSGYEPFEIHQVPDIKWKTEDQDLLQGINEKNSLRFQKANLKLLFDELSKCKYFFGVDAGVFYLALSLLGRDNICFLRNRKNVSMFVPVHINQIDVLKL